jgi:hypothetical protein
MNEVQFAHRIRQHLQEGTKLEPALAARLRAVREQALAAHRPERAAELAPAGGVPRGLLGLSLRVLLPAAVLCVAFVATYAWQQQQRAAEVEELDAQLLSGDLPIDAYLDQGFAAWLKRRASQ